MACVKPNGELTELGRKALEAVLEPSDEQAISAAVDQPVYRVRSIMRALGENGLAEECPQGYCATQAGRDKLAGE